MTPILKLSLLSVIVVLGTGCANLQQQVEKRIDAGDYNAALTLLEKAGAATEVSAKASPNVLAARDLFDRLITERFLTQARASEESGHVRKAHEIIIEGLNICPWSSGLSNARARLRQIIQDLDVLTDGLHPVFVADSICLNDAAAALRKIEPLQSKMNDTPMLLGYREKARTVVAQELASWIEKEGRTLPQSDIDIIVQNMCLLVRDPNVPSAYGRTLQLLSSLPVYVEGFRRILKPEDESSIQELTHIFSTDELLLGDSDCLRLCRAKALDVFKTFCETHFTILLEGPDVTFRTVCIGEQLLEQVPGLKNTSYQDKLATAHIHRARYRSTQGKVAAISLVHLQRSVMLGKSTDDVDDLRCQCLASLATDLPVFMSISIDGNPGIDPMALRLVQIACATQILSDTRCHWKWQWLSPVKGTAKVRIYMEAAQSISTPWSSLSTVSSQYLSHFEDTPNPMKAFLKSELDTQEWTVNSAKSQYQSAVSFHNINPTTYSLQNANNAYTRYSMAVDQYNRLVNQYNVTPATISRPVYLPYSFREGTVESGWRVTATIVAGPASVTKETECIESDFVRYGTKFSDEVVAYRRDDPLTVDVGIDAHVARLTKVSSNVRESLGQAITDVPIDTRANLDANEGILLMHVLHPFGITKEVAPGNVCLRWAVKPCEAIELPDPGVSSPERILLATPAVPIGECSAKEAASLYDSLVCEIESPFGKGSGVLVSPDGIVLTCAHVLLGTDHCAIFHTGSSATKYELDILFVNDRQDVAVARARGLRSESWAPVCLSRESVKGETIVSVGNPALSDYTTSVGAVSQGIVSNPVVETISGQERMVCDIMVAQGSSGGPIISLETGYVVGIVTHIAEAGIRPEPEVSTSGWSCLAAPAHKLGDWLGLAYGAIDSGSSAVHAPDAESN